MGLCYSGGRAGERHDPALEELVVWSGRRRVLSVLRELLMQDPRLTREEVSIHWGLEEWASRRR